MASSIIRFEPNVPQRIALKFSDGKEVDGQYGPQMYFSTDDGRTFYLDLPVAGKLTGMAIKPRQPFTITKRSRSGGAKGWDWEIVPEVGTQPEDSTPPVTLTQHVQIAHHAQQQPSQDSAVPSSPARLLMSSLMAAVDAAIETEAYATRKGMLNLKFGTEDIRAMAATVFIQVCKQAENRGGR